MDKFMSLSQLAMSIFMLIGTIVWGIAHLIKGTIGNKNGFWGDAVKMEEVGITEITEEHLVEIVEEMFTKK